MKKMIAILLCIAALAFNGVYASMQERVLPREEIPAMTDDDAQGMVTLGILIGTPDGPELEREVTRAESLEFIWRTVKLVFNDIGYLTTFDDVYGHWARDTVDKFYHAGYVSGTSETTFEPDRGVTGREFVRIMLSAMGYDGVTVDNAYDKGIETDLLNNNFTKSVVKADMTLLRSDAVRLCRAALTAKVPEGGMLYERLVEQKDYEPADFEGILFVSSKTNENEEEICSLPVNADELSFADKINAMMPEDKNYMFSPLSIKYAFAMAANGAAGETRQQLLDALEIDDLDKFNNEVKALIEKYEAEKSMELNIANSVWVNQSKTSKRFNSAFSDILNEYYKADAEIVDNANAVEKINSWVSEKTNDKIKSIIDKPEFIAALVNAVYFKADWRTPFLERATQKDDFTTRGGEIKQIDFMNKTDYLEYYKSGETAVVKLPYRNYTAFLDENGELIIQSDDIDVSMYLMTGSIAENPENMLNNIKLSNGRVQLSMPKFKSEFQTSLNTVMQALGVSDAFDKNKADFSPMISVPEVFITDTIHKTYIDVDENGTEAAAVTGIMAGTTSAGAPAPSVIIKFDRPFSYIIRDDANGEILFMGEYAYVE